MSKKNRERREQNRNNVNEFTGSRVNELKENSQTHKLTNSKTLLALLVIIIAPVVTYWNSLEGEFHFDDYSKIVENPDIRTLKGVFVDGPKRSEPRMVSNFTLYLNYKLDGYNVRYYHAFNIALHCINCVLIYFVVLLMLRKIGLDKSYLAFLTSLFFALHPINTEPLNYIVHGRFIILCTMFYLLGILLFILAFEPGRKKWLYLAGCFICYILSVFSKEVGITLPGILFFYYLYFICDSRKAFFRAVALFGVALGLVIIYALWYGMPGILKGRDIAVEYLLQLKMTLIYLKLYLLPLPALLNVDHALNFIPTRIDIDNETIFSAIVIIGLVFLTVTTYKRHRLISFSLLYLFITHSPTTLARKGELIAEYKNYLPFFGFAFFTILCLSKIFSYFKSEKNYIIVATLIMSVVFAFADIERNKVWESELSLWNDSLEKAPNNPRGYYAKGIAKGKIGDYKGEIENYTEAIKLAFNYSYEVYSNRGVAKGKLGDYKGAIEDYNKTIELNPNYAEAYYNRGNAKYKLGDYKGAIEDYNKTIELNPNYAEVYNNRGTAKGKLGNYKEAIEDFNKAITLNPEHADAYHNRGDAEGVLGNYKEAIEDYDKLIELNPNYSGGYEGRGNLKNALGDYQGAIEDWGKAIELNYSYKEKLQPMINKAKGRINR